MTFKVAQLDPFSLAGGGAIASSTSITLQSMTDVDGNALSMSDFGTKGFGTLDPGNGSLEEQISFTGLVNNTNGTVTLTGISSVTFLTPYTETSGLSKTHAGSAPFVISNTSGFYNQFAIKDNDETITGQWTFSVFPITPSNSDASTTVKGVTKLSSAPASPTDPIAVGDNDSRLNELFYAATATGNDSYAITLSAANAPAAYAAGQVFTFKADVANTGAATLNVNSLGAKSIKKNVSINLVTGDILAGQIVQVQYDGTNFQILSNIAPIIPVTRVYAANDTWSLPAGLTYITVQVVGGGGDQGSGTVGGAGGGGGLSSTTLAAASLSATETVTVGAAGSAGAGGNSSFGSHLSANGGSRGSVDPGSGGSTSGGAGGSATGGTLNITGNDGQAMTRSSPTTSVNADGGYSLLYNYGRGCSSSGGIGGLVATGGIVIVTEYYT